MTNLSSRRTVIFAGGGTGGHLFPGIAVAQELIRQDGDTRVLFVGSEKPLERDIVGQAGFEHIALPSESPSFAPMRVVPSLLNNWRAYRQARTILARETPSVVIGLGGFASVPPVLAARRARIPIVLLEQNVVPGKATRWLSRFANVVCLPWEEAAGGLPKSTKTIVTGNPIRQEIEMLAGELASGGLTPPRSPDEDRSLLVLGGSQGATTLNALVLNALEGVATQLIGWRIIHQTGASDLDEIRQRYAHLKLDADVQPFLHDMAEQYRRATCVISRAGATTLAELACAGLPAILVPLPTSAHDHQRLNAQLFADRNAALLIPQQANAEASIDLLQTALVSLLSDDERQQQLRDAIRSLAKPNAATTVIDAMDEIWRGVPDPGQVDVTRNSHGAAPRTNGRLGRVRGRGAARR